MTKQPIQLTEEEKGILEGATHAAHIAAAATASGLDYTPGRVVSGESLEHAKGAAAAEAAAKYVAGAMNR